MQQVGMSKLVLQTLAQLQKDLAKLNISLWVKVGRLGALLKKLQEGGSISETGKTAWTEKRLNSASEKVINRLYDNYQQRDLNQKGEKTGKAVSKHLISLYSQKFSRLPAQ